MKFMNARMESSRITGLVAGIAAALVLLGLGLILANTVGPPGTQAERRSVLPEGGASSEKPAKSGNCAICGTVESIRTVEVRVETERAGIESGRPIGSPPDRVNDNSPTTLFGAAGSLFSGADGTEDGMRKRVYRVTVRMDDGSYRAVSLSSLPAFAVGDRVRVLEGKLVRA